MPRHIPQDLGFDAVTCDFETTTEIGQILPIHSELSLFEIGRDMICGNANDLKQPLQREPQCSVIGQLLSRKSM